MQLSRTRYLDGPQLQLLTTHCQEQAALDRARGRRQGVVDWMFVDLAISTGLRSCELAAVRIGDLDLRSSLVRVVRAKKRDKAVSEVSISPSLKEHIGDHLQWMRSRGDSVADDAPLLMSKLRGRYSTRALRESWARILSSAGLPPVSLHGARHSHAVALLASSGGNLMLVKEALGHTTIQTTANVYGGTSHADRVDALQAMTARYDHVAPKYVAPEGTELMDSGRLQQARDLLDVLVNTTAWSSDRRAGKSGPIRLKHLQELQGLLATDD